MKKLIAKPNGWPCTLEECPPGLFVYEDEICFKSEYINEIGKIEAFCESGEYFCKEANITVQPVIVEWEEE